MAREAFQFLEAVLAQADKMITIEREFKRAHLGLLVRLRNLLTGHVFIPCLEVKRSCVCSRLEHSSTDSALQ